MHLGMHDHKGIELHSFGSAKISKRVQNDLAIFWLDKYRQPVEDGADNEVGVVLVGKNVIAIGCCGLLSSSTTAGRT